MAEGHARSQVPQCATSTLVSMQRSADEHHTCDAGQRHAPPTHSSPARHDATHDPQARSSVLVSTHPSPGQSVPLVHRHAPDEHVWPDAQVTPHPPQFVRSLRVSTQRPPHSTPDAHAHPPRSRSQR